VSGATVREGMPALRLTNGWGLSLLPRTAYDDAIVLLEGLLNTDRNWTAWWRGANGGTLALHIHLAVDPLVLRKAPSVRRQRSGVSVSKAFDGGPVRIAPASRLSSLASQQVQLMASLAAQRLGLSLPPQIDRL